MENSDFFREKPDEVVETEERLKTLENELLTIKNVILKQNDIIKLLTEKIVALSDEVLSLKSTFFSASTGNGGVKQTNKQTNKQTLNKQLNIETPEERPKSPDLRHFHGILVQTFRKLSKQELKTFLTIYQLEDESLEPSYQEIAEKMGLSETCIRQYTRNLIKKGLPLLKKKLNNKNILFFIEPDFKNLNVKNVLIHLYYDQNPSQSALF